MNEAQARSREGVTSGERSEDYPEHRTSRRDNSLLYSIAVSALVLGGVGAAIYYRRSIPNPLVGRMEWVNCDNAKWLGGHLGKIVGIVSTALGLGYVGVLVTGEDEAGVGAYAGAVIGGAAAITGLYTNLYRTAGAWVVSQASSAACQAMPHYPVALRVGFLAVMCFVALPKLAPAIVGFVRQDVLGREPIRDSRSVAVAKKQTKYFSDALFVIGLYCIFSDGLINKEWFGKAAAVSLAASLPVVVYNLTAVRQPSAPEPQTTAPMFPPPSYAEGDFRGPRGPHHRGSTRDYV